jgi:hypothetical protein
VSVITIEHWLFPRTPFELSEEDRAVMLAQRLVKSGYHKDVAYKPAQDRLSNFAGQRDDSGQYVIEQTFRVPRESLLMPDRAPISILEGLAGARMQ